MFRISILRWPWEEPEGHETGIMSSDTEGIQMEFVGYSRGILMKFGVFKFWGAQNVPRFYGTTGPGKVPEFPFYNTNRAKRLRGGPIFVL